MEPIPNEEQLSPDEREALGELRRILEPLGFRFFIKGSPAGFLSQLGVQLPGGEAQGLAWSTIVAPSPDQVAFDLLSRARSWTISGLDTRETAG